MNKLLVIWKKYSYIFLFLVVIAGMFDSRVALVVTICMVGPIIVSLFRGRFWCGNICPRGSFFDNIVKKFSKHKKVPSFLKSYYFRILVIIVMMTIFTLGIRKNLGNIYGIGMVFYRMIVITTVIGLVLALFINERTWCNFCPMGTIAALITKLRKNKKNLKVSSKCVSCGICEKKCPMGISAYEYKGSEITDPDCIQCLRCELSCPKNAIGIEIEDESEEIKK
ncbi:4Fe-4S binding protein [Clostridium sp. BJN0001]|uniref:4Fe-4S binding protein n=1 Tax=Clostridium sp. BJN0001 TaxID=2930219 RepID=UPI001FD3A007|nr:4Fe-4S binding protein [Clostridium sp. BJN0001]